MATPSPTQQPLSFRRSAPTSVTHHPQPLASSPPISFRSQFDLSATSSHIARPVATRTRPGSFAIPQRPDKNVDCLMCETSRPGHARSRSHGEMRALRSAISSNGLGGGGVMGSGGSGIGACAGTRMVSFGSTVTPASGGSTTDGDELEGEGDGRTSFEWPWDEEDGRQAKMGGKAGRRGARSDSSGSEMEGWPRAKSPASDRRDVRGRARYSRTVGAPRSQSALAGGEGGVRLADGPRPWDMTELSQTGKNFASFGFRKNGEGVGAFGDAFTSRHLPRQTKGKAKDMTGEEGLRAGGGGRRRFRFLRRKLSVSNVLFRS